MVTSMEPVTDAHAQDRAHERKCCRYGCAFWCRKYFWEGQLSKHQADEEIVSNTGRSITLTPTRRKALAFTLPALLCHAAWWSLMIGNDYWHMFEDKYYMTITMVFGSVIAGMTSEGGGAIAFPVMTLALGISPVIARDFSFMIQSCGMSAAAFTITFMRIKLEHNSLLFCSLGGTAGLVFGLHIIDPNLSPAQKKMYFVSIWFSFAFALYLLNRNHKRKTFMAIPNVNTWKIAVLLLTGFIGGCFSSFAGSGIDICSFSMLCLLFRVSEKVATPTSVVLMAINTCIGFFWRGLVMQQIESETWEYLLVCIPVVVLGAPIGSLLGSHFHRLVLANLVYVVDVVALIGAFAIVPQTPLLAGVSCAIIAAFFCFFLLLTRAGATLMDRQMAGQGDERMRKDSEGVDASSVSSSFHFRLSSEAENGSINRNISNGLNGHINSAVEK